MGVQRNIHQKESWPQYKLAGSNLNHSRYVSTNYQIFGLIEKWYPGWISVSFRSISVSFCVVWVNLQITTIRAGVNRKRHRDGSIWDLSILMGYRYMRIFLWCLFCDGIICGPLHVVDGSPLYEDPAEVRSADRPCTLDMYNAGRSFTHESNTCVIKRWSFLILGYIDLLFCICSSLCEDSSEVRYRSTLCTWYVQHNQEFRTRVHIMCN